MTVAELIEKLSTLNPDHDVFVEVDHGDVRNIVDGDVEEMQLNDWGTIAFEDEEGKDVVVIKA